MEFHNNELSLIRGCAGGGVLKWDDTNYEWDCGTDAGSGAAYWELSSNTLSPGGDAQDSDRLVLGGADTTVHQLEVNGAVDGKALVVFDEDGDQNILSASASSTTVFNLTRSGDLEADGVFSFGDTTPDENASFHY